jgi:hypothetical protein
MAQNKTQTQLNGAASKEDEEEELIPVGDGVADLQTAEPEDKEDDDSEDSKEDTRLSEEAQDDDDEDREKIRAFRRKRRANRKDNLKRDRLELNFLRQRNDDLERRLNSVESRTTGAEVATVDQKIAAIQQQIDLADQIIAGAISSNEPDRGQDVVKAQRARDQLIRAKIQLETAKEGLGRSETPDRAEASGGRQQAEAAPVITEVQRRRAGEWFSQNRWYDPKGSNAESRKVAKIDQEISAEGFDPATDEYWDEFEDRVRQTLPHLYDEDQDDDTPSSKPVSKQKPSGPKFTVGGRERSLKRGEVYISPERRKALEDAGVWEDPKLRARYLKRYAEYDRDASRGNGSAH